MVLALRIPGSSALSVPHGVANDLISGVHVPGVFFFRLKGPLVQHDSMCGFMERNHISYRGGTRARREAPWTSMLR